MIWILFSTCLRQSYQMAESLYLDAAEKGQYQAYCNLGYIYYYGRTGEPDYKKAFECFNRGVLLASDGNCYYKLGDMYRKGLYVEKDPALAFQLYLQAGRCEQTYQQEYLSGDPFGNEKKNIRHLTHLLSRLFQELDAAETAK